MSYKVKGTNDAGFFSLAQHGTYISSKIIWVKDAAFGAKSLTLRYLREGRGMAILPIIGLGYTLAIFHHMEKSRESMTSSMQAHYLL